MRYSLRLTYTSILIILCQLAVGQTKLQGSFINSEKVGQTMLTEVVTISSDSIWFSRKKVGKNIASGEKFETWAGTVKYRKTGYNNGPFYSGAMTVISCDTCPEFWKYTDKRRDSTNLEMIESIGSDKVDTIINNGDTSYMSYELMLYDSGIDLDRKRSLIFTVTNTGDILLNRKIFRRQKEKPTK